MTSFGQRPLFRIAAFAILSCASVALPPDFYWRSRSASIKRSPSSPSAAAAAAVNCLSPFSSIDCPSFAIRPENDASKPSTEDINMDDEEDDDFYYGTKNYQAEKETPIGQWGVEDDADEFGLGRRPRKRRSYHLQGRLVYLQDSS